MKPWAAISPELESPSVIERVISKDATIQYATLVVASFFQLLNRLLKSAVED